MSAPGLGQGNPLAGGLPVTITSLEMRERPAPGPSIPAALRLERAETPTVPFYRFLYNTVGEDWLWDARRRWSDAQLAEIVQNPAVEVWVLSVGGQPAGYAELDRRVPAEVELAYFGLMPAFVGRGLGPHLLRFVIREAWVTDPRRLWVHTCTFDHPAALRLYQACGFVAFETRETIVVDPRREGLIRTGAAPHIPLAEVP